MHYPQHQEDGYTEWMMLKEDEVLLNLASYIDVDEIAQKSGGKHVRSQGKSL